jgi:Phytanoyl-CoA dioxygenase (PhyH)
MSTVGFDFRTRTVEDVGDVDPAAFLDTEVPALLERNGEIASRAMRASGLESIVIAVDGHTSTWALDADGRLRVDAGDHGRARADLSRAWFSDLVRNVRSAVAVLVSAEPVMTRGNIMHLIGWETVLRALVDGRPAYEPGLIDFVDRTGAQLDLTRTFIASDDPAEMAQFLGQTGFLLLRGVFTVDELSVINTHIDTLRAAAIPEDASSWWGRVGGPDGEHVCVRVNDLPADALGVSMAERFDLLVAMTGVDHQFDHIDVLMKPVDVTEGISDLPWHKDCSLGLHSYQCMQVIFGLSITASGPDNGQLGVVAGSHRVNIDQFGLAADIDLPQVFIATAPGDVTVHLSCTLHSSTPPLHSERRVAYSTYRIDGDTKALEARIREVRDQAGLETFAPA